MNELERVIVEEVPGQEVTLCHIIANPHPALAEMMDLERDALAILSVTPSEAAYIAADFITKAAQVTLVFVDRYLGTVLITGTMSAVQVALDDTIAFLSDKMGLKKVHVTRS